MKTKRLASPLLFLCSFFLALLLCSPAPGQTIDSITITPTTPGPDDEIRIDISGTKTNTCYEISTSAGLDTCGVWVDFQMTKKSGCFSFPGNPVGWEKTARVDPQPEGNYTISAELREGDTLRDSMTTSFFVIDGADVTDVQIIRIRSSLLSNLHVEDTLTLMIDAVGPEETAIEYRFYSRYGAPGWSGNPWILEQDWSESNSTQYTFTTAGPYYVIGHVRAQGSTWGAGDPQGGFVVEVKE
jgi:hypothetical protein